VILLISASQVARITGMSHQLCLGLLRAEITGTYHYVWFREGIFFFFFFFGGTGIRAQGLMLARQTFYPLSHSSSPTSTLKAKNNLH
jgi:hypothetical protein